MISIIVSFIMWLISLTIAFVCIRQPKGIDWYAPISKKQKMIMSLINLSILIFIIITALGYVNDVKINIVVISICCVATIVCCLVSKNKTAITGATSITSTQQNTQIDVDDGPDTLKDIFSKVLTVFNSVFITLNITYCVIIVRCQCESWCALLDVSILELDSIKTVLPVHITFVFWSALAAIIMTSRGWKFSETINSLNKNKKVTVHTAKYYADRITNRNRKRSS